MRRTPSAQLQPGPLLCWDPTIRIVRWSTFGVLIAFRRWRHLLVLLGAIIVLEVASYQMTLLTVRPRPLGVTILTAWNGFSLPSLLISQALSP